MSNSTERSQSMTAYAQTFGEPDTETTSRLRKHLRSFVETREARRVRGRHWVQASLVVGALAVVAGGLVWTQSRAEPNAITRAPTEAGVLSTGAHAQRLELANAGVVELGPNARVRIVVDEAHATSLELLDGALTTDVPGALRVQIGRYRVEATAARLELRPTRGVPLVEVERGTASLYGPDLPSEGVKLTATGR